MLKALRHAACLFRIPKWKLFWNTPSGAIPLLCKGKVLSETQCILCHDSDSSCLIKLEIWIRTWMCNVIRRCFLQSRHMSSSGPRFSFTVRIFCLHTKTVHCRASAFVKCLHRHALESCSGAHGVPNSSTISNGKQKEAWNTTREIDGERCSLK